MTLLAHAPLQKSLTVTTYSSQPDANGIHNVASTATLNTTMTSDTYESVNVLTPQETRISDVFAFKLDKTKNVNNTSMPSDANIISFWGYVGSSWNLYIRFAGNMYKNDQILFSYDDFTLTYAGTNFGITANKDTYIADIRFHKIDDVSGISAIYAMLNKHPKTPSFGFYQLAHSSNIGIVGNQLDDSLVAFKKGSDDTSFHLADIQCNEIHSKTIDDLKNGLQNINLSYDANGTDVNLQYLYENKLNSTNPVFSGSLTGPELKIGTQPQTGNFIHGSLQAGSSTLSSLKITGSLTDGSTLSTTLQALANKADSYTPDDSNVPVTLQSLHNNKIDTSALSHNGESISNIKQELDKKAPFALIDNKIIDCDFLYNNKLDKVDPAFSYSFTDDDGKTHSDTNVNLGKLHNSLISTANALTSKLDDVDPTFSGILTGPELKIGTLNDDDSFTFGTLSAGTISSTIISNDGTTKTHTLHNKAEAYSYDSTDDAGNPIKVPVTLETLDNKLITISQSVDALEDETGGNKTFSRKLDTLVAHFSLQETLDGSTYVKDAEYNTTVTADVATISSVAYINVETIGDHSSGVAASTLVVSGISAEYDGNYVPVKTCSIKAMVFSQFTKQFYVQNYNQIYPLFKKNDTTFLCKPNPDNMIKDWTFFTTTNNFVNFVASDEVPVQLSNIYPNVSTDGNQIENLGITGTSTFKDFTYPLKEGAFSHNFDTYRVFDTKALSLSGELTMPKKSDHVVFWGWTAKAPSWSLYTASLVSGSWVLKKNNTDNAYQFTINTNSNDLSIVPENGVISYILDVRQYSTAPAYDDVNVHPKTPILGFYQIAHSENVGIVGNQLDDTMRVLKIDSYTLGNFESQDMSVAGNLKVNGTIHTSSIYTTSVVKSTGRSDTNGKWAEIGHDASCGFLNLDNSTVLRANAHESGSTIGTNLTVTGSLTVGTTNVISLIGTKVATSTYDTKMSALDTAIAGKVAKTTYDTKMSALDTAIAGKQAAGSYAYSEHWHNEYQQMYLTSTGGNYFDKDYYYVEFRKAMESKKYNTYYKALQLGSGFDAVLTHNGSLITSDDRLKSNEKYITNATESLLKLKPQSYMKKKAFDANVEDATFEVGLIAQEIWYDAPELRQLVLRGSDVSPADDIKTSSDPTVDPDYSSWGPEPASVNYVGFVPYLIRGFQEHHEENVALKARVETLENQIAMLMKAVGLMDSGNVDSA